MKARFLFSCAGALSCGLAKGLPPPPMAVGTYECLTVTETTPALEEASLFVSPLAVALQKKGVGKWTLPLANVVAFGGNTLDVQVAEGTLQLAEGTSPDLATPPSETLQQAALWLEAARNRKDVSDGGETRVEAWFDAREESAVAVRHAWAKAGETPPCVKVAGDESRASVFFSGCQKGESGRGMRFMDAAGKKVSFAACHVFAVHAFDASLAASEDELTCSIFGVESGANAYFTTVETYTEAAFLNRDGTAQPHAYAARFYRNGVYANQTAALGTTCSVFELEFPLSAPANTETLFNDRNSASGGGQLYEVFVFTNRLTEAERLSVGSYLLKKWVGSSVPTSASVRFEVGSGATLDARAAPFNDISVVGEGAVLCPDAISWPYGSSACNASPFDGAALSFAGRTLAYDAIGLPWLPLSGETLSIQSSQGAWSNLVTSTTGGAAGTATVNNDGGFCEVRVMRLPEDVRSLSVSAGTVTLAAPNHAGSSEGTATYPVPNGDFEAGTIVDSSLSRANTADGWTFDQGDLVGEPPAVGVAGAGMNGYAGANWGAMASGSRQLLFLSTNGTATSSAVQLPTGTYRLRVDVGRWTTGTDAWRVEEGSSNGRCGGVPALEAIALVKGVSQSLGKLDGLTSFLMETRRFPVAITLDAPASVSLHLRQSVFHGAAVLDNLVFEPVAVEAVDEGIELVRNGSFATNVQGECNGWEFDNFTTAAGVRHIAQPVSFSETSMWGAESCDDRSAVRLAQQGHAMQSIEFSAAGYYQFSCWMRPRVKDGAVAYDTAVQAWLVSADGVTTQQVYTTAATLKGRTFLEHRALFRVPTAGTWTLCLCTVREKGGEAFVDCVSVRRVSQGANPPELSPETEICVARGAKLRLDYIGTNAVQTVRYAGRRVSGVISAETRPDFVVGTGAFLAPKKGTLIVIR